MRSWSRLGGASLAPSRMARTEMDMEGMGAGQHALHVRAVPSAEPWHPRRVSVVRPPGSACLVPLGQKRKD